MGRRVGREAAARLLQLPFAPGPVAASGLVPGNRDVHEALEEVPLLRLGLPPGRLERLVGGEELPRADQPEPVLELSLELRVRP